MSWKDEIEMFAVVESIEDGKDGATRIANYELLVLLANQIRLSFYALQRTNVLDAMP